MISPSAIKRVKYTAEQTTDFVHLQEYIIFEDDRDNEKYIVFKFKNCVAQWLHELKFIVFEFDSDNQLIQKVTVVYKEAKVKENSTFVPSAKFRANGNTDHIAVELEKALFEKMEFNKGETKELKYDYTDFKKEQNEDSIQTSKVGNHKDGYIKPTFEFERDKKQTKKKINIKNITNRNRSYAMPLFSIISAILITVICIFLSTYSKEYATTFYDLNGIEYTVLYDDNGVETQYVSITGSMYNQDYIKVENQVTNTANNRTYTVKNIKANAFLNKSNLRTVEFDSKITYLTVESLAFNNCQNLNYINLNYRQIVIKGSAFNKCSSLSLLSYVVDSSLIDSNWNTK